MTPAPFYLQRREFYACLSGNSPPLRTVTASLMYLHVSASLTLDAALWQNPTLKSLAVKCLLKKFL
jgi:hypothetical protein